MQGRFQHFKDCYRNVVTTLCSYRYPNFVTSQGMKFSLFWFACSCRAPNEVAPGCSDVSRGLEAGLQMNLDPDRELQRIHSLFIAHNDRLDRLRCNYAACAHCCLWL